MTCNCKECTCNLKVRGFEVVADKFRKHEGEIKLPQKGTKTAMAYDFYSPIDLVIEPNKIGKIWTDVKAKFNPDEALLINVRSSMGKQPVILANVQGWVESDYYSNPDNDGNIGIRLFNLSNDPYYIATGDRIAQGMFIKYLTAESGNTDNVRQGGFGSTNK